MISGIMLSLRLLKNIHIIMVTLMASTVFVFLEQPLLYIRVDRIYFTFLRFLYLLLVKKIDAPKTTPVLYETCQYVQSYTLWRFLVS